MSYAAGMIDSRPARSAPTCDVIAIHEDRIRSAARRTIDVQTAGAVAATFKLMGNPMRVRIVDALSQAELCVCDLAVLLDTRISALSHQLALLKEHRIVKSRRAGKMLFYSLDDHHVKSLFEQAVVHSRHDRAGRIGPQRGESGRPRRTRRRSGGGHRT